ncbi:MAG: adenylate/guanylate cyclase domain-containing protein [bacterium]
MSNNQSQTTILFADVCRSTQLFETLGDIKAREIIAHAIKVMMEQVEAQGGRLIKTIGDEAMCVVDHPRQALEAACEIHEEIARDMLLAQYRLSVKIGLHYGDVIHETDGDVYGDAVNVAARMVAQAKSEQIVATGATLEAFPGRGMFRTRDLGRTKVRGKAEPVQLVEVLWQDDTANITTVAKALNAADLLSQVQLSLRYKDQVYTMRENSSGFEMGRDPHSDIIVDAEWVSRNHASLEIRQRSFVLVDRSTNGTYVQIEDEEPVFLHRDEMQLRKQGVISLGQNILPAAPLLMYYQVKI